MGEERIDITQMLRACRDGDASARGELFEAIYDELRGIARRRPGAGRHGETMQPTVLANEAAIAVLQRMDDPSRFDLASRREFYGLLALTMRALLKDHWRAKRAAKRGGGAQRHPLAGDEPDTPDSSLEEIDFMALDEAMDRLHAYNPGWHETVMHRYYAGRSIEETAELLGVGVTKVKTDWRLARAWLLREIQGAAK